MKKRNIIVCSICMLLLITLILLLSNNNTIEFTENGAIYALTVDGIKQNKFPSKGLYRVDTDCSNAVSKWDYDAWKLNIEKVTGDVTCNISFTTITKNNFSDYIKNISGTTQGAGKIEHELTEIPNFTNATKLTQSEYGNISQYSSTGYWHTSGTIETNAFSYSNNEWVSNPSNLTTNTYYHINFSLPAGAYYRMCYEMSNGHYNNSLYFIKDTDTLTIRNGSNYVGANTSGCVNIGYISKQTSYRIVQRAYSEIATVKFYVQKINEYEEVLDTGYRYQGQDPNNYVWFNNELWRIIGVMNEGSHGHNGTNLVKIIRNESIGTFPWNDSTESIITNSNWNVATLKMMLNEDYIKSQDGTNGPNCFNNNFYAKSNCDYRTTGLKNVQNMIKEVTWHIGGIVENNYEYITADQMYKFERDKTGNSSIPSSVNAKVGLMYASDYGFAVPGDVIGCTRKGKITLDSYNQKDCTSNNWLFGVGPEWTITSKLDGDYSYAAIVSYSSRYSISAWNIGNISRWQTNYGMIVRPTLYLNENVYVLDGDGSITDPYIIAMDEA